MSNIVRDIKQAAESLSAQLWESFEPNDVWRLACVRYAMDAAGPHLSQDETDRLAKAIYDGCLARKEARAQAEEKRRRRDEEVAKAQADAVERIWGKRPNIEP